MNKWEVALRLFASLGMAIGAWEAWRALPKPTKVNGRRYYRQPDGSFRTAWGLRVRDPALLAAIEQAERAQA